MYLTCSCPPDQRVKSLMPSSRPLAASSSLATEWVIKRKIREFTCVCRTVEYANGAYNSGLGGMGKGVVDWQRVY